MRLPADGDLQPVAVGRERRDDGRPPGCRKCVEWLWRRVGQRARSRGCARTCTMCLQDGWRCILRVILMKSWRRKFAQRRSECRPRGERGDLLLDLPLRLVRRRVKQSAMILWREVCREQSDSRQRDRTDCQSLDDDRELPRGASRLELVVRGVLRHLQPGRAIREERRAPVREVQPAILELGERRDQLRRRLALARRERLHFVDKLRVGESRERGCDRLHASVITLFFRTSEMTAGALERVRPSQMVRRDRQIAPVVPAEPSQSHPHRTRLADSIACECAVKKIRLGNENSWHRSRANRRAVPERATTPRCNPRRLAPATTIKASAAAASAPTSSLWAATLRHSLRDLQYGQPGGRVDRDHDSSLHTRHSSDRLWFERDFERWRTRGAAARRPTICAVGRKPIDHFAGAGAKMRRNACSAAG